MKAVWLVRSRQLKRRMKFWIAMVGYDPGDRSISHRIYLLYVIAFFSVWGFAVLALLADQVAGLLAWINPISSVRFGILLTTSILLIDCLLRCYRYARRSPFIFSEDDAALICLTPVDRRQVALAWLVGDWIPAGLPYWAGAVALSFSFLQLTLSEGFTATHFPFYALTGIRAVSIILPLHLALMSITYVFGALRLRKDHELLHLRLIPLGIGAGLLLLVIYVPNVIPTIVWPVAYPLEAAFGMADWWKGFIVASILVFIGLILLYLGTPELNLSRASQESHPGREAR